MAQKQQVADLDCITGGPCSGKTDGTEAIVTRLQNMGLFPVIIPETATFLFGAGFDKKILGGVETQRMILQFQYWNEKRFLDQAQRMAKMIDPKCERERFVIPIADRGILDGLAYTSESQFREALEEELGLTVEEARMRYENVYALETAARGAEQFYSSASNKHRDETPEEARRICKVLREHAYIGANKVIPIENISGEPYDKKLKRFTAAFLKAHGYPEPVNDEQRYEVYERFTPNDIPSNVKTVKVRIIQDYLETIPGIEERVRSRDIGGTVIYYHSMKPRKGNLLGPARRISRKEYLTLLKRKDRLAQTIVKDRYCFMSDYQYFELDFFQNPVRNPRVEVEPTREQSEVKPPVWLPIERATELHERNFEIAYGYPG